METMMFDLDSITIIDDDIETAEAVKDLIEDLGLDLKVDLITDGHYDDPEQIVEEVMSRGGNRGVVCDHRLQHQGLASFYGSELLSKFYHRGVPGALVTQFSEVDANTSIRLYRQWVPGVIDRELMTPQTIIYSLSVCQEEIKGKLLISRRVHRTLVNIVNISREDDQVVADAFIPGWSPKHAVRFPIDSIQPDIQQSIIESLAKQEDKQIFTFAMVNIGAKDSTELFFHDFEPAVASGPSPLDSLLFNQ
jgi:hypothetical protein